MGLDSGGVMRYKEKCHKVLMTPIIFAGKSILGWVPVAHTCQPCYLRGRDQEDLDSKPAQANSLRDPISKNPSQK
jgi:hypothetical protein